MFLRDAKQAEVMLSQQENYLSKDETPTSLEQAENMLKRHQDFLTTMDANDEKIKVRFIIAKFFRVRLVFQLCFKFQIVKKIVSLFFFFHILFYWLLHFKVI